MWLNRRHYDLLMELLERARKDGERERERADRAVDALLNAMAQPSISEAGERIQTKRHEASRKIQESLSELFRDETEPTDARRNDETAN